MSRTAKAIMRDRQREREEAGLDRPQPFSPDHKVYPQGWSWAMIERESARRYASRRDAERAQDWVWAVDEPVVYRQMTKEARRAAHEFYEHRQAAIGDVERVEDVTFRGGFHFLGASWAQARSAAIAGHAERYVRAHPEATTARMLVFDQLFRERQPTLTSIRFTGAYNAKGKAIHLNQLQVIKRIVWCCEALADCDAGLTSGYGPAI